MSGFALHLVVLDVCGIGAVSCAMLLPARLHIQYPMLFKLNNNRAHRVTHCGVLEFVADEGRVYLPYWVIMGAFFTDNRLTALFRDHPGEPVPER